MIIINPTNLSATLDAASEAFFHQMTLPPNLQEDIAKMIINRHVSPE